MKKFLPYVLMGVVCMLFPFLSNGQVYAITNSGLNVGNPGGVRTSSDFTSTGSTTINAYNNVSSTTNVWSAPYAIPFAFDFYGSPVTHFITSKNGLLSFDTTNAGTTVSAALDTNSALPNANLPNNTIAYFWDDFPTLALGSNDNVLAIVEGTAPNRQLWVLNFSYRMSTSSFNYWAVVFEETSNKIYVVDMNYASVPTAISATVGVQINGATSYQVTTPLNGTMGSPNIQFGSDGSAEANNEYYEFLYLPPGACVPPTGLMVSGVTATSATASWTTGGAPNSQVEFGPSGFSLGSGTQMFVATTSANLMSLSANTAYDVYVRDSCASNSSIWVGPVSFTTPCVAATTPFSETFDAASTPSCWSQSATSGGPWLFSGSTNSVNCAAAADHTGNAGSYAWMDQSGGDAGVVIEMPDVDVSALTTPGFQFYYWMCGVGYTPTNITVIESWDGSSWNAVDTISTSTNGWERKLYDLTSHTYGANLVRLRFRAESGGASLDFYGDNAIDDVEIDEYNTLLCSAPFVAPFVENFDATTTPACWTLSATTGGPWRFNGTPNNVTCSSVPDHTGNAGSYAWMDQSSSDAAVIMTMPEVDVSALTTPYLNMFYWMCGSGYTPPNKTYIETYDGTIWTVFDSIVTSTNGWENFGFDLTPAIYNTNLVQVRFRAESGGSGFDFYGDNVIDDVSIIEAPTCFQPSGLGATNITANSADFYFTTGGAANWNVEYGIAGFTFGTGTRMAVTNDTVNLMSLNASATYDVYVQDSCGAGDVSAWSGPFTFNTLCGVIVPPSLENFNNGFPPNCWDEADGGTPLTGPTTLGTGGWGDDGFGNLTSSGAARINLYNVGDEDWVLSPLYDLTGADFNAEFDFGVFLWNNTGVGTLGSDDEVQFLISTDTGATWINLATYDSAYVTAPAGNHEVVSLAAYTGQIVMFAFWATEGTVDDPEDNDIFVDNFEILDPCATLVAPYMESFDATTTPACWTLSATTGGPWRFNGTPNNVTCSSVPDHTGNAGSYAWMDQSSSDAAVIMTMPMINVSALTTPYLSFYYWMCGSGYTPPNKTYIETYDGTVWTVFDSIVTATNGWENFGYDLTSAIYNTDKVRVRFRAESGGSGFDFYGDNVIDDVSIMEAPTCFQPSALGATNITANSADFYFTTGGAANWNVEYGLSGFAFGSGTRMAVTNDTVNLMSLNASATYDVYVQDSCGAGDVSAWSGPFTFNTLCGVIVPPSLENFNNGFPPNCWDEADGGTPLTGPTTLGTGGWGDDGFGNLTSSGAARINLYNVGDEDWVLSPLYDLSGGTFNAEFDFGVFLWNNTGVGTLGSDDEVQFLISTDTGATWINLATYDSAYVTAPAGNHEVVSLAAYTGQIVMFAFWATEGTVDDPEDNDIFVDNFEVSDPCASFVAPFLETFDGSSTPACWSQSATTGGPWLFTGATNSVNCPPAPDYTGNSGSYAWMDQSTTDAGVILEMPEVDISPLTNPYLEFQYWMCGVGYTPPNITIVEAWDGTSWVTWDSIQIATNGWMAIGDTIEPQYVYNTSKVRFRFRAESGGSTSDFFGDNAIDNVGIFEAASCFTPTMLGAFNITDTSADVFWTTGGASNWQIEYGPIGFTPGSGTLMNASNDTTTIGGLMSATQYDFYVRDSCGMGDVSMWAGPFGFTTPACATTSTCTYQAQLRDSFGDAWNGGEVTIYQAGVPVAVLTYPVINGGTNDTLNTVSVALCDSLPTYVVITTLGGFPEEMGVRLIDPLSNIAGNHNATPGLNAGDTLFSFTSSCVQPGCPAPSALGSTNITQSSADVYWTAGGSAITTYIEYGPQGFTPGTGTKMIATNDTVNLSSLAGATTYTFCVYDSCASGVSLVNCADFTTLCGVFVAPYTQTFDGTSRPVCWSDTATTGGPWIYGGAGTNSVNCSVAPDHTGNAGNYAWMDQSGTDAAVVLETPIVDVSGLTTPYLDFFYWMCGAGYTPPNKTYLEYWDGTSWVLFDSIVTATAGWEYMGYDLTGRTYGAGLATIRFRAESGGSGSDFFGDNAIDDVSFREKPLCLDPTGLVSTGTTLNSVTLAWNSDTNITAGIIEYGPTGFALGTGTQVPAGAGGGTVSGLMSGTCYDFYATDSCGNSILAWMGPVNACTGTPCTVTTVPTNVKGDTTACGGGLVDLTASSTGNLVWATGGEVIGRGSPFTPDSIFFTTNYTAHDFVASGLQVHVGPLPSIAASGFGNFTNGQWITVQDTIIIDSCTVRANGYVNAQVWIQDVTQTRTVQRGEVFETDSNVTANYQVPVGVVLTPGQYYVGIDFDVNAVSLGQLFRATGGAAYPYVAAGLMSIDSVNFPGARYYYTFDMIVRGGCLSPAATPMAIGYVPGANAGMSDSVGVCSIDNAVNLAGFLGVHDAGGTWSDDNSTGALTDSIFDATAVAAGTYNFTYLVSAVGGCGADSATIQVTVVNGGNAGPDTAVSVCITGGSVQLRNFVPTAAGGVFANLDNASGVIGGSLVVVTTTGAGTYRFQYTVPAGICPADTSMITLTIDPAADAGGDATDTICDSAAVVDLSIYLSASAVSGGTWKDVNASGGLTGSNFDPSAVTAGANYTLRYVVDNSCGADSADINIYVRDCSIGLDEFELFNLEVYPNPTAGIVNIRSTEPDIQNVTIELYSTSGKLLLSREVDLKDELPLDISHLADGVYNLKISTDNGSEVHQISKM